VQAGELEQDEPHGVLAEPAMEIPPITEGIFSVAVDPQDGQGMFLSGSLKTSSSYTLLQDEHRYSNMGIKTLLMNGLVRGKKILDVPPVAATLCAENRNSRIGKA
jgi:hypothetical protein